MPVSIRVKWALTQTNKLLIKVQSNNHSKYLRLPQVFLVEGLSTDKADRLQENARAIALMMIEKPRKREVKVPKKVLKSLHLKSPKLLKAKNSRKKRIRKT